MYNPLSAEGGGSGEETSEDGGEGAVIYKEITMPACDRAMLLCLVLVSLTVLGISVATFVKANEALSAIVAQEAAQN